MNKKVISILLFMNILNTCFAAYPLTTDDAGTVCFNNYELELSYDNCSVEDNLKDHSCGLSFKYGITEKMDFGISIPIQINPAKNEALGGSILTAKFAFIEGFAATFSNELGEKEYFINTIFTKKTGVLINNFNVGYLTTSDENIRGIGLYGFSIEYPIKSFAVIGEIQGQEGGYGNFLLGGKYKIYDHLFVALGAGKAFDGLNSRLTIGVHSEF